MTWTALIPLNAPMLRKSRLAPALGPARRAALAEELYRHVMRCVEAAGVFMRVFTLSPPSTVVSGVRLVQQESELNAELTRVRTFLSSPLLVLNADLPLLAPEDLRALVAEAASTGCALAPDRHGTGTNATALLPGAPFQFSFGPGSLVKHLRSAHQPRVVCRTGLAYDLDTPADIAQLLAMACPLPGLVEHTLRGPGVAAEWAHAE